MLFLKDRKKGFVWGVVSAPALVLLVLSIIIFGVIISFTARDVVTLTPYDKDLDVGDMVDFFSKDVDLEKEEIKMIDFIERWYLGIEGYDEKFESEVEKFLELMPNQKFANLIVFYGKENIFEEVTDKLPIKEKEKFSFKVPLSDGTILDFNFYRYGGYLN